MELYDKKFVHFMWDDELKGKKCFLEDSIGELRSDVETNNNILHREVHFGESNYPFDDGSSRFRFAYYDPNYEVKKAFNESKTIQIETATGEWVDVTAKEPVWTEHDKYRVKPEEEKWIVYLSSGGYLTACREDAWDMAQEDYGAKTKLFVGSKSEATKWYVSRRKFTNAIEAWEDGKMIQIRHTPNSDWVDLNNETPQWHDCYEYRVKPEEKKWRPYESSAEMIADFIDRFNANCPSHCEPLIWLKSKIGDSRRLVTAFEEGLAYMLDLRYSMQELLSSWTYLDGSPVGMEQ